MAKQDKPRFPWWSGQAGWFVSVVVAKMLSLAIFCVCMLLFDSDVISWTLAIALILFLAFWHDKFWWLVGERRWAEERRRWVREPARSVAPATGATHPETQRRREAALPRRLPRSKLLATERR